MGRCRGTSSPEPEVYDSAGWCSRLEGLLHGSDDAKQWRELLNIHLQYVELNITSKGQQRVQRRASRKRQDRDGGIITDSGTAVVVGAVRQQAATATTASMAMAIHGFKYGWQQRQRKSNWASSLLDRHR
ncbi:hypothetical protein NL676_028583 [Syzygium grande]|nr:hypothetical protein NL676_028583 [Syzygium grande]